MWVLLGPFDGDIAGDVGFQKRKLLKPNKAYTAGRKDRPLLINNKKISHDHCDFEVGPHTADDVINLSARPSLMLMNRNKKDKSILITREGVEGLCAPPSSRQTLQEDDTVSLITGVCITVKWMPICAYVPNSRSKSSFPIEACASLGIKLVRTLQDGATHYITTEYRADLTSAAALLSLCKFVKLDWLLEVVRLGNLPRNNQKAMGVSLEDHFVLPLESMYRPSFLPSLLPSQKTVSLWEPNEERVKLFQTCRFICLHEKNSAKDTDLREAIHRADGELENFDIHSGVSKFRKSLTRSLSKEGKKAIVVGDPEAMQLAIGQETWNEFISESKSAALNIISPSKIVDAALAMDTGVLFEDDEMAVDRPSIPGQVSRMSEEPLTQASRPRLVRRATSRAASREPSIAPSVAEPEKQDEEPIVRPRKALTRRAMTRKPDDDPSLIMKAAPLTSRITTPPPEVVDLTAPTPIRPSKLKRRYGATKDVNAATQMSGIEETIQEPALKKFKALFEASNAAVEPESHEPMNGLSCGPTSQTQMETGTQLHSSRPLRSMGGSSLAILREEEEETQGSSLQRGTKRRLSSEEDVEMQIVDETADTSTLDPAPPASKKRALINVNSVERTHSTPQFAATATTRGSSKPPSAFTSGKDKEGTGAAPGKPDTDAAFLKAIASTKRGKKTEDVFDREFNKLKISKPELEQREPEEEWAVLADFGDDSGLRGNFMVVVEMEVFKKEGGSTLQKEVNRSWDGKPDFKKFKKKVAGYKRHIVDLFVSEENDYGIGNAYWKGSHSQVQTQMQSQTAESQMEPQPEPSSPQPRKMNSRRLPAPAAILGLEDDPPPPTQRSKSRKPPSRAPSAAPSTKKTNSKPPLKAKVLFLDSDEDVQEAQELAGVVHVRSEDDDEETLKSSPEERHQPTGRKSTRTGTAKPPSKAKKQAPVIVDDDSDDEAVFKGFKGKGRRVGR